MCQCDTDAPAWGFCMRKTISLFIWDGTYQWDRMYVLDRTYRQGCCYMQGHKNQQMTKNYTACKEKCAIFSNIIMGGSTGETLCPDSASPTSPGKSQATICLLWNMGMDTPREAIGPFQEAIGPLWVQLLLKGGPYGPL